MAYKKKKEVDNIPGGDAFANRPFSSSAFAEGSSLDIPPLLEPAEFLYWKKRFELFVKSKSLSLWRIIEKGDFIPSRASPNGTGVIVKSEVEWSIEERNKVHENIIAMHLLYCALPDKELRTVFRCDTAHDIWETLEILHEGTSQLKNSKIHLLAKEFETFRMLPDESIDSMYGRYIHIINSLKPLGRTYTNEDYVMGILNALPSKWNKVTIIQFFENLSVLSLENLICSLKAYEMRNF